MCLIVSLKGTQSSSIWLTHGSMLERVTLCSAGNRGPDRLSIVHLAGMSLNPSRASEVIKPTRWLSWTRCLSTKPSSTCVWTPMNVCHRQAWLENVLLFMNSAELPLSGCTVNSIWPTDLVMACTNTHTALHFIRAVLNTQRYTHSPDMLSHRTESEALASVWKILHLTIYIHCQHSVPGRSRWRMSM